MASLQKTRKSKFRWPENTEGIYIEIDEKSFRRLLDELNVWLIEKSKIVLSKSLLGKTIAYSLKQWELLSNYLLDCTYLFEKLPNIDIENLNELDALMPWTKTLPAELKIKPNDEN